jgi:hypothetical protein
MLLKKFVLLPILDALKTLKEENLYEFNKKSLFKTIFK